MTDETTDPVTPEAEPAATPVSDETPTQVAPSPEKARERDKTQERIDELTWRLRETERQLAESRKPPEPPPAKPVEAPKLEDFEFDQAKYTQALTEWQDARIEARVAERLAKAEAERAANERTKTFQQRQQEFMAKTPDYAEKVLQGADRNEWPCSEAMAELIRESELGPQVAYHLASNPQVARELYGMSERAVAREIGRIEARLEKPAAPVKEPVRVSQAPPPPAKIEAAEATVSVKPTDPESDKAMSDSEWLRARNKQVSRRGRGA